MWTEWHSQRGDAREASRGPATRVPAPVACKRRCGPQYHVPQRFELLPARGIREMTRAGWPGFLGECAARDGAPAVEIAISAPVAFFQLFWRHARRAEHSVARIVEIPIAVKQAPLFPHTPVKRCARIRRQDVEGGCLD